MRVLLLLRSDARRVFGGDVNFAEEVAPFLHRAGHEVVLSDRHPVKLAGVDLLNIINLTNIAEAAAVAQMAARAGLPLVATPDYINLDRFFLQTHWKANVARLLLGERAALTLFRARKAGTKKWRQLRETLRLADRVIAKSAREKGEMVADFKLNASRITVIPNGVDPHFARGANRQRFIKKYGVKDFLLTVGRVEPLKNQRSLLLATQDLKVPLVFIGGGYTSEDSYLAECRRRSRGRPVTFIDRVPHDELKHAYAAARAVVVPSYAETTSLVALEAVLAGCPVALTKESPYGEYFGEKVVTLDPYDLASIQAAADQVLASPRPTAALADKLVKNMSWSKVGEVLAKVYREVAS